MAYIRNRRSAIVLAKLFLIYPFLFILGLLDLLVYLITSGKHLNDPQLPDKNSVLTRLTDKSDPTSAYKSTLPNDIEVKNSDNIYDEFVKSVNKFANFNTLGVRQELI